LSTFVFAFAHHWGELFESSAQDKTESEQRPATNAMNITKPVAALEIISRPALGPILQQDAFLDHVLCMAVLDRAPNIPLAELLKIQDL
jgi:hypothetical protein